MKIKTQNMQHCTGILASAIKQEGIKGIGLKKKG